MVPRTTWVPQDAPAVLLPAAAAVPRAAAGPAGALVTTGGISFEDGAGVLNRTPAGTVDGGGAVLAGAVGEG